MKRILTVLSLLFVPLFVSAENKIKMVTYFPVPYVAYSKINAQKQLDVGLTSACEMNLGCAESGALGTKPLQAATVNLNRGKLDLNNASAVKSTNVTLGSGNGEANIDFEKNLRIGTLNNGYSLEANDMRVDELKLFASHMRAGGEKFPSCAATGAAGAPQVSWQKLKLKNAEEVYLMCGTPKEGAALDCSDASYKASHKSECCPKVSTSDDVCYMDCADEDTFEWGSSGRGVEDFLGSDWKGRACSRDAENGMNYGQCFGSAMSYTGGAYPCWDILKLAASGGLPQVAFGEYSADPRACDQAGYMCEGEWDENNLCLVIDKQGEVTCDWYNNIFDFGGVYQLWRCNRKAGSIERCKNGW